MNAILIFQLSLLSHSLPLLEGAFVDLARFLSVSAFAEPTWEDLSKVQMKSYTHFYLLFVCVCLMPMV